MTVLAITNIYTPSDNKWDGYRRYLMAMLYLERITEQNVHQKLYYNHGVIAKDTKDQWIKIQNECLIPMIAHSINRYESKEDVHEVKNDDNIPPYICNLIEHFLDNKTIIDLSCIQREIKNMSEPLKLLLFEKIEFIQNNKTNIKYEINNKKLNVIFPNLVQYKHYSGYWVNLGKISIASNHINEISKEERKTLQTDINQRDTMKELTDELNVLQKLIQAKEESDHYYKYYVEQKTEWNNIIKENKFDPMINDIKSETITAIVAVYQSSIQKVETLKNAQNNKNVFDRLPLAKDLVETKELNQGIYDRVKKTKGMKKCIKTNKIQNLLQLKKENLSTAIVIGEKRQSFEVKDEMKGENQESIQKIETELNQVINDQLPSVQLRNSLELYVETSPESQQRILIHSIEYKEIQRYSQEQLSNLLQMQDDNYFTSQDLLIECTKCSANDKEDIYSHCESIQRIIIVLTVYKKLMNYPALWRKVSLLPILIFRDIYTETEMDNDFTHIREHMKTNIKFRNQLQAEFETSFKCIDSDKCDRDQMYQYSEHMKTEDIVFQQHCDKIHSYFMHPYSEDVNKPNLHKIHSKINLYSENKKKSEKGYIGKAEDEKWWDYKQNEDNKSIYRQLVENMSIFRWQSPHGFTSKQHHGIMHLKPKYKNVKEEALQNPYYPLSTDSWNQTVRKSKVFFQSYARKQITTCYDGIYDDKIAQQITEWKKDDVISLPEITTFKLYTDFDKLQYELKQCFRFETISDIFTLKNFDPNNSDKGKYDFDPNAKEQEIKLELRLRTFYRWRIGLLTMLNKFGREINPNVSLYHGVNAKMILNNGGKKGLAFYGPLSTSTSYHVARTFATAKGMVLQITTQYPRLGICRAFDASLISDYPEEKELLLAFAYLRIKSVITRPLHKYWKTFDDIDKEGQNLDIPLASKTRSICFAIHLFREQIFSMSVNLEYWLSAFLYLSGGYRQNETANIKKADFVETLENVINNKLSDNYKNEEYKHHHKIMNILWRKFDNFRKFPNHHQVVRIDQISDNLKPYFMDIIGGDDEGNEQYTISFAKIIKIFENVKEIHFINNYPFNQKTLNKLIKYFDENTNYQLKTLKFLYYDYQQYPESNSNTNDGTKVYPLDSKVFYDERNLDKSSLNRLETHKWKIQHRKIEKTGYQIKIFLLDR